ncbi:peptidoglycan-binding protein [Aeromonas enteropelogenes]|uniref:peptidoglycan-binding protein n=1 Tax=Aeromonas enteropelogenes TaxID=29489 RepID=UPI003BA27239
MKKTACCPCSGAPTRSIKAFSTRIAATLFGAPLDSHQSVCIGAVIAAGALARVTGRDAPFPHQAYVLATIYHETAHTMRPIEEYGKGEGRPYGAPDPETGQTYYGRGYVQLTWRENYQKASVACFDPLLTQGSATTDFVMTPGRALMPFFAAQIALFGMGQGWFTGKRLSDYDTPNGYDYINARRIINGTDRAELIAGYARLFEEAARLAAGGHIERATLSKGSHGSDVIELQLALGLPHDGVFGQATRDTVEAFQSAHGLNPDGVVGRMTWDTIDREVYGL